jgi:hypothetical protein
MKNLVTALGLLQMAYDKKLVQTVENDRLGLMADIGKFLEDTK